MSAVDWDKNVYFLIVVKCVYSLQYAQFSICILCCAVSCVLEIRGQDEITV